MCGPVWSGFQAMLVLLVHTVEGFIKACSPNNCLKWTTCSSQCSPDTDTHTL